MGQTALCASSTNSTNSVIPDGNNVLEQSTAIVDQQSAPEFNFDHTMSQTSNSLNEISMI